LATAAPARQAGGSSAITASSKPGVAMKIREEAVTPRSSVNVGPARVDVGRIEHELHQIAHGSRTEELDPALALVGWGLAFVSRAREASPAGAVRGVEGSERADGATAGEQPEPVRGARGGVREGLPGREGVLGRQEIVEGR